MPLWAQVYEDLLRRIEAGEFEAEFPAELTLVEEYGVSRQTVRQAMRPLRAEGRVIAERGRRPRIADPLEVGRQPGALHSILETVETPGLAQSCLVRALEIRRDPEIARSICISEREELLYLERLRMVEGTPLVLDKVWLPKRVAHPLLEVDFTHSSLYSELESRAGVALTSGAERIRPVLPSASERKILRLTGGTPCLRINRLGFVEGRATEWRDTLVRGDRVSITMDFPADTCYRLASD